MNTQIAFTQTDNLLDQCFLLQAMTRHAIVHHLILLFILFSFSFTRKITVQYISCFYVKGACTTLHLGVILIYLLHANFDKICTIKWRIWMCKNIIVWKHSVSVLLFLSSQNYWKSWANWRQVLISSLNTVFHWLEGFLKIRLEIWWCKYKFCMKCINLTYNNFEIS